MVEYQYNMDGIRTSKVVNGKKIEYSLENNNIVYEKRENKLIYYFYDSTGLLGFEYEGNKYYYIKNLQNDIVGITDSSYNQIVVYEYDPWGEVLNIKDNQGNDITDTNHIGIINPFRYRGYYYDSETNLYYLNSRYYSPELCRFLNADQIVCSNYDVISFNLYLYVSNNFINYKDYIGKGIPDFLLHLLDPLGTLLNGIPRPTTSQISSIGQSMISIATSMMEAVTNSLVTEVGIGAGMSESASMNGSSFVEYGVYQDATIGTKGRRPYSNVSGNAGISLFGYGIAKEYTHPYPFDFNETGFRHEINDFQVIPNCPMTTHEFSINIPFMSVSENKIFIGIDKSWHFGFGGHIKVGLEFNR